MYVADCDYIRGKFIWFVKYNGSIICTSAKRSTLRQSLRMWMVRNKIEQVELNYTDTGLTIFVNVSIP